MGIYSSNIVTEASELFSVNESQYMASRPGLKTITESKKKSKFSQYICL